MNACYRRAMRRFASIASGLFACVTGCGDDGGARKLPDAPLVEDGLTPDMIASGSVNITTMSRCCDVAANTPVANVLVVAVNADGSLAGTAMTDAQGKASLDIREGATVTAVYPEDVDNETVITSYVGVKPNDELTFGDAYFEVDQAVTGADGQMTINWPMVTNATSYVVYTPCETYGRSATGLTLSASLYEYCQTPTAPIVVTAFDANSVMLSSAYLPSAPFTVGAVVNLVANDWVAQAADSATVSISSIDSAVTDLRLQAIARFPGYSVDDSYYPDLKLGEMSSMLSIPQTAPQKYARARLNRNGNYGEQNYFKGGTSPFALTGVSLPWINDEAIVSPSQYRVVWIETAGEYDAAVLDLFWERYENKQYRQSRWRIVLPPGVADFRLGTPPAELAPFLPTDKDYLGSTLTLVDLSSAASYDAARALPEWRVANPEGAVASGDEPSAAISSDGEGFSSFSH